jgi:hypothetical protein
VTPPDGPLPRDWQSIAARGRGSAAAGTSPAQLGPMKSRRLFETEERAKAKERQREHGGTAPGKHSPKVSGSEDPHANETTARIGSFAGVSGRTVATSAKLSRKSPDSLFRGIADLLAERPDGGGQIGLEFAGRLAEAGRNPTQKQLAVAFGFARRRGQHRYETIAGKDARDGLIRELADRYFAGLKPLPKARGVSKEINGYLAIGWLRECHLAAPPPEAIGGKRELLWRICRADSSCTYSVGTIRRAL